MKLIQRAEGVVADVVSDYELAITAGSESGVEVGDRAVIYREIEIAEPKSGRTLGTVRRPALNMRIVEVHPEFSVGQTTDRIQEEETTYNALRFSLGSGSRDRRIKVTPVPADADYRTFAAPAGTPVVIYGETDDS